MPEKGCDHRRQQNAGSGQGEDCCRQWKDPLRLTAPAWLLYLFNPGVSLISHLETNISVAEAHSCPSVINLHCRGKQESPPTYGLWLNVTHTFSEASGVLKLQSTDFLLLMAGRKAAGNSSVPARKARVIWQYPGYGPGLLQHLQRGGLQFHISGWHTFILKLWYLRNSPPLVPLWTSSPFLLVKLAKLPSAT